MGNLLNEAQLLSGYIDAAGEIIAEAITGGCQSIASAIIIAAMIRGFMNK